MSKDDGGPAFPLTGEAIAHENRQFQMQGITKQEYFVAKLLQGFAANPAIFAADDRFGWGLVNVTESDLIEYAFHLAAKVVERKP